MSQAARARTKQMIKSWRSRTLLVLAVIAGARLSRNPTGLGSAAGSTSRTQSQQASMNDAASLAPFSNPPLCPEAGLPATHGSSDNRHHKVTLTWKASAPSVHATGNPVGYCLYRSTTKGLAKMAMAITNARCGGCEQVNRIPIPGTGCVDDLVEDDTTYYYMITAISPAGLTSASSDEAIVQVPHRKSTDPAPSAYPSCRVKNLPK